MVTQFDWELEQMDVKTAFLHGELEETIYMNQPKVFKKETKGNELVCLLKRSMYGLKHSPRQWYKRFDFYVVKIGFSRSNFDNSLHWRDIMHYDAFYLLLYVDDMLICSAISEVIQLVKDKPRSELDMKDFGPVRNFLGISILRDKNNFEMRLL